MNNVYTVRQKQNLKPNQDDNIHESVTKHIGPSKNIIKYYQSTHLLSKKIFKKFGFQERKLYTFLDTHPPLFSLPFKSS